MSEVYSVLFVMIQVVDGGIQRRNHNVQLVHHSVARNRSPVASFNECLEVEGKKGKKKTRIIVDNSCTFTEIQSIIQLDLSLWSV